MTNQVEEAVKTLVKSKFEREFEYKLRILMDAAVEHCLQMVSDRLIVKFVPGPDNTFSVEFTWKDNEP